MSDLIRKQTRLEIREYFVAMSTLRAVRDEFDAADIEESDFNPPVSGERRTLVERYYHSLDFENPADVQKFLSVCSSVLGALEILKENEAYYKRDEVLLWIAKLTNFLKRDGYRWENGELLSAGGKITLDDVKTHAVERGSQHLLGQISRIEASIEKDPPQAIGSAKELLETCCKVILSERGKPVVGNPEITELASLTLKELQLVPDGVDSQAKGAETIKKVLRTLFTTSIGIAELRNLYGTGHGKDGGFKGLGARHARLAVGSAGTVVRFLLETHRETLRKKS